MHITEVLQCQLFEIKMLNQLNVIIRIVYYTVKVAAP